MNTRTNEFGTQVIDDHAADVPVRNGVVDLVQLATPMIIARGGIIFMTTIDIVMIANYAIDDVAYLALGLSVTMPMVVITMGLLMGTHVLSANHYGAGEFRACGQIWRRSLPYAILLGCGGLTATQFGEPLLRLLGQSEDLARHGGEVIRIAGYSLPSLCLFLTTQFFLEGIKRPGRVMIAMVAANALNFVLNGLLIFGSADIPPAGAAGAAWATTIARTAVAAWLIYQVWTMFDHEHFGIRSTAKTAVAPPRLQRRIGYGASLSIGGESIAFAALSIFAGWMGASALAAFSLTFNILTMVFMLALGLGAGTAVRVGISHGRGNAKAVEAAGWTGLVTTSIVMAAVAVLFFFAADEVVGLFTNETTLLAAAASLVSFAAYLLVIDGGQAVMANALRGRRDVWLPCVVQVFSFVGLMVPCAYVFAFSYGMGPMGLILGMLVGCCFSFLILTWRFRHLAVRDQERGPVYSTV